MKTYKPSWADSTLFPELVSDCPGDGAPMTYLGFKGGIDVFTYFFAQSLSANRIAFPEMSSFDVVLKAREDTVAAIELFDLGSEKFKEEMKNKS